MEIRKATKEDFEEYFKLETIYMKEHNRFEIENKKVIKLNKPVIKKNFIKKINQRNKLFLVVEENNKLEGYFFGEITQNKMQKYGYEHKKINYGYIENVYLTKKTRGKGIFKQFFNQFKEFLKKNKIKSCELHVDTKNKIPKSIYEKMGFETVTEKMSLKLK